MANIPWYPLAFIGGLVLAAMVTYYSSQISFAQALGNRPTRIEVTEQIAKVYSAFVREMDGVKDDLAYIRSKLDHPS